MTQSLPFTLKWATLPIQGLMDVTCLVDEHGLTQCTVPFWNLSSYERANLLDSLLAEIFERVSFCTIIWAKMIDTGQL